MRMTAPIGVGLRPTHMPLFLGENSPTSVSWVEVITENFLPWSDGTRGAALANLERVRERYDVALHGVSLNLGSTAPLNPEYLTVWAELIARIQPVRISDHLCWTGIPGKNAHDLLPLPYTEEALAVVCEKVDRIQSLLGRPLVLENVSAYVEWDASRMSEADFLTAVVKRTGCGLLLDLNNVFVTSKNLGGDARKFIASLPVDAVEQIHLAGPSEDRHGFLIDTHDSEVREEVWDLYRDWTKLRTRATPVMIERDEKIPEWGILEAELLRIAKIESAEAPAVRMGGADVSL